MLVVSDSSPLNFLVRLQCVHILPQLFQSVLIPREVADELSHPATPPEVKALLATPPPWLQIRSPAHIERIPKLHAGEEAAISLAREIRADLILIDDRKAREEATARGLTVTGLLGVLERAAGLGLIELAEVVTRLPSDYRIDQALVQTALDRDAQRKKRR